MKKYYVVYEATARYRIAGYGSLVASVQVCLKESIEDMDEFAQWFFEKRKTQHPATDDNPLLSIVILNIIPLPL